MSALFRASSVAIRAASPARFAGGQRRRRGGSRGAALFRGRSRRSWGSRSVGALACVVCCNARPTRGSSIGILGVMAGAGRKVDAERPVFGPRSHERLISWLAGGQHGVVSRAQLREIGLSDRAISRRCAAGSLHRVHQGVYAVGHALLTARGRWMAAVLAGGPGAALSHNSAAALWELRPSSARFIDVTTRRTGRARSGLRIHRPAPFTPTRPRPSTASPSRPPRAPSSTSRRSRASASSTSSTATRSSSSPTTPPSPPWPEPTHATAEPAGCCRPSTATKPAPPSPEAASNGSSSPSASTTASRGPRRTRGSKARRSTSSSKTPASSSRPTRGSTTRRAAPSRTTAPATPSPREPATAPSESPTTT